MKNLFIILIGLALLSSCAEYTRRGKLKDEIFGIEHRANGVVVVWVVHDDVGSYCFNNRETAAKAEDLFKNYDGKVIITYDDGSTFDGCPSSTEGNHVYTAREIYAVEEHVKATVQPIITSAPTKDTGR